MDDHPIERQIKYDWHNKPETCCIGGTTYRFKSKYERKWACYLQFLYDTGAIDYWEYEPKTFEFKERYRTRRQYTPDFLVKEEGQDIYHELKTSLRQIDVRRFKYLAADFPDVQIILVMPCGTKKFEQLRRRENAAKYVKRILLANPIFKKFGIR